MVEASGLTSEGIMCGETVKAETVKKKKTDKTVKDVRVGYGTKGTYREDGYAEVGRSFVLALGGKSREFRKVRPIDSSGDIQVDQIDPSRLSYATGYDISTAIRATKRAFVRAYNEGRL